jgi:hypothetical protein
VPDPQYSGSSNTKSIKSIMKNPKRQPLTIRQSFYTLGAILGLFAAAGTVAPEKAKSMPIETSNSPIFKQNFTFTGGANYGFNQQSRQKVTPRVVEINGTHIPLCQYGITPVNGKCPDIINRNGTSFTGYGQGAVRVGGNTAILGGYDSNGKTIYGAAAAKFDGLAITAGADRYGIRYSAAYSVGPVSPFYARQQALDHYGVDIRMSDNFSINGAYRGDGSYLAGVRLDVGGGGQSAAAPKVASVPALPVSNPPALKLVCPSGYYQFQDGCMQDLPPAPTRVPVDPRGVRGRG